METTDFSVSPDCSWQLADRVIEAVCEQMGLTASMKGSLSAYPGSVHWHYKNGKLKGTLELTLDAPNRRICAQIHLMRGGDWLNKLLPLLRKRIEDGLRPKLS